MMKTFFKPTSLQLPNGKWVSRYSISIQNGDKTTHRDDSLDVEFDSEEEANVNAFNYCIKQGFTPKE